MKQSIIQRTKLDFIRQLRIMNIAVMPLYHRSKTPILSTWGYLQSQLPSEQELNSWFPTDWNNYAVICGWNNLVVIDFDTFELFDLWRLVLRANGMSRIVETSFKVITSKGFHVYLRTAEKAVNSKRIARSAGIDVQAVGKYVVGPGCVHPNGTQYVPVGELRLIEVPSVESVLPVEFFPHVRCDDVVYNGAPVELTATNTEYQSDPLTDTRDLISKVKASVRIESLFPSASRSSRDGRWLKALCPFHDDRHESFWIDVHRQLCGCQVCGMKPMDAINLQARIWNVSESVAVRRMAENVGVWR